MFFHLLYIHLFRPFLKYNPSTSPLPTHVSPRKLCTSASSAISKLMRLYKRTYGLRQICNIAVYMVHSACTIHLLNLPDKAAKRDIVHGVKHLEEIAEDWLCARRTLSILSVLARKWGIEMPEEARGVLDRTDAKYGTFSTADVPSPKADLLAQHAAVTPPAPERLSGSQMSTPPHLSPARYNTPESGYMAESAAAGMMMPNNLAALSGGAYAGAMGLNADNPVMNMTASYLHRQQPYSLPPSARRPPSVAQQQQQQLQQQQQQQAMTSAAGAPGLTRQVSPSTMFGGVEALVESQDWWLRDQASLAVGFENWEGLEMEGEGELAMGLDLGLGNATGVMGGLGGGRAFFVGAGAGMGEGAAGGPTGWGAGGGMGARTGEEEWYS